jgi:hypothetical protein
MYFMHKHERVLAQLRVKVAFDEMPEHEQGKVYAEHVGSTSLARFFHLARRGELNVERLGRIFKRPEYARSFSVRCEVCRDVNARRIDPIHSGYLPLFQRG